MPAMMSFVTWFLEQLPAFLMSEPICYFVGFVFLFVTIALFQRIINIHR